MFIRFTRLLSQRVVADKYISHFINRELLPFLFELSRALSAGPIYGSPLDGELEIDVSRSPDIALGGALSADATITLLNGQDGCCGYIYVQQDAVGGWELSFAADSRVILREPPAVDDFPDPTPSAFTRYRYHYVTIGIDPYLVLERKYLA